MQKYGINNAFIKKLCFYLDRTH